MLWRIRWFFYLKLVFGWSVLEGAVRKAGVVFGLLLAPMDVRDSRLWSKKQNVYPTKLEVVLLGQVSEVAHLGNQWSSACRALDGRGISLRMHPFRKWKVGIDTR